MSNLKEATILFPAALLVQKLTKIQRRPELDGDELIHLCQNEDPQAQQALYDRFAVKMFRTCFRYLKNEQDAEDVMISGFVKVFKNIHRFENRHKYSLEAWIRRIMVNESLMLLRKNNQFNFVDEFPEIKSKDTILPDSNLQAEDLYRIIRQLPNGYRTVFNLYVIEGYSHKEIAEQLGVSENTSKSQLSKAKAMLRRLLAPLEEHK